MPEATHERSYNRASRQLQLLLELAELRGRQLSKEELEEAHADIRNMEKSFRALSRESESDRIRSRALLKHLTERLDEAINAVPYLREWQNAELALALTEDKSRAKDDTITAQQEEIDQLRNQLWKATGEGLLPDPVPIIYDTTSCPTCGGPELVAESKNQYSCSFCHATFELGNDIL